ncbi:MAG: hypothetical protein JXR84_17660 [Anaerolineae bacterium]|nr:hypothetical protein [Anaerolineae bacterium]
MSENAMGILFILMAVSSVVLFLAIMFFGIIKATKALKRAGGLQGIAAQIQAQSASMRPALKYPIVMPTFKARTMLVITVILLFVGLALIAAGWLIQRNEIREARLLQTEGIVVTAKVTGKEISEGEDSDTYYVSYSFSGVANDQHLDINRRDSVPWSFYGRVEYGGKIDIIYARSDPRIVRIHALYTPGKVEYWPLIILGGVGMLILLLTLVSRGYYRKATRLDNEGMLADVLLLDCFKHEDSDSVTYYVAYELPGVGPVRHSVSKKVYEQLIIGETIRIAYLPDMPKVFRPLWE